MAQTKPKAGQFYGVSDNGTDGQFLKTDGTGGMSWDSPITNPTITSIDYPGSATAADPAGGESVIINGTLFASGITCTVGGTSAVTAFNSATQITITTPAKSAGPYTVAVLNPDGGTASQANFIQYSGVPVWSTAAGTLGNVLEGEAASFQVTATEGSDTIEYAVTTGTLPTGLSLATATGAITGTAGSVSADTTTTFSITATDDENQTSASRSFSITVQNDAPSNHFNTVLYTGNGGTQSVTGVGFAPDFTWIKGRNITVDHAAFDTVRGATKYISPSTSGAEGTYSTVLNAFGSDGFTVGSNSGVNASSSTYVAWNFKAGGAAVANTDGTINSQVSANNTLGFSIVSYTGNGSSGNVGHGLNAIPELIIAKNLDGTNSWVVRVNSLGNGYLTLNATSSYSTTSLWGNPTNSVFNFTHPANGQTLNNRYIAYCFTSKPGFSKVGSYTGTGAAGNNVVTGFEPAFLMVKRTDSGDNWLVFDNKRNTTNPTNLALIPNSSAAESVGNLGNGFSFYANGFQVVSTDTGVNANGGNYIYLAFAADGSTATPSLANSFATELYTGNGGTKSITTGFKPDFTWIKQRNITQNHRLFDSVRGATNILSSSNNNAQGTNSQTLTSFNSNGFSLGNNVAVNTNSGTYVSWNWKAGVTPSINTDGTITSLVSANQAAGFSVVDWTTTAAGSWNVGHGLDTTPEMIISKMTSFSNGWEVYHKDVGTGKYLQLSTTAAAGTDSGAFSSVTDTTWTSYTTNTTGNYIAYCFTSISGYSKVGTYTGNGSTSGPTITTGFEPSFVMIKRTDNTGNWWIVDNKRSPSNPRNNRLLANTTNSEVVYTPGNSNFLANGFQLAGTYNSTNASGGTYIYIAIKEN